jgi:hypothetical protein
VRYQRPLILPKLVQSGGYRTDLHTLPNSLTSAAAWVHTLRARHPAHLVVLRQGPRGPEMLRGVRGVRHQFIPNRLISGRRG